MPGLLEGLLGLPAPRAARFLTSVAGLAFVLSSGVAAQTAYRTGPPPPWVHPLPVAVDAPPPSGRVTGGFELLLLDRQEAVLAPALERFRHVAYRLLDEAAVQDQSQIEIIFDSSYEQLTLHSVTVTRAARSSDQLQPNRIRVVQKESRLDYQIYDGSLSLVVLLEDVRRGDVVEYSYTIRGANPVFAGHYMTVVSLQAPVPLHQLSFRLIWPSERELFVRRHDTSLEPAVQVAGQYREYVWSTTNVAPKVLDADLPSWYEPFPGIQLSDFASWSQVAAWGDSLFAAPAPLPPALEASLAAIRSAHRSTAERVLSALRFVQDDVRYLGVEIGINSHVPAPPATVIGRRYGDCKDKALLLVTMLRALGVTARPALVSTDYGGHIRDWHATAKIFDHAIVQAEVAGRVYWLDGTALHEGGRLESVASPFGAALVLGRSVDSLSTILSPRLTEPLTDVSVSLELGGVGSPADMRVETEYRGRVADATRSSIHTSSVEELQRRYTDFYSELYPAIRSAAPPQVSDDEAANLVHTTERYSIPDFWHFSRNQNGYVGTFEALELAHAIPSSTAAHRTMPLAVTHPGHIRYTIKARLQQGWHIAPEDTTIETPAVHFSYRAWAQGEVFTLSYDYATVADHVVPRAVADHLEKLSRIRKLLVFSVTPPSAAASPATWADPREWNWSVLLAAVVVTTVAVLLAVRLSRAPAPTWPRGPAGADGTTKGLGGWLILVGIGVSLGPLPMLLTLLKSAPTYTASSWARLTTPSASSYHVLWAPTLLFELVSNLTLIVFSALLISLFFRRRRLFPAVFVIFIVARVIIDLIDAFLANAIPAVKDRAPVDWSSHSRALTTGIVWVTYMFRSRRVQNTFVN